MNHHLPCGCVHTVKYIYVRVILWSETVLYNQRLTAAVTAICPSGGVARGGGAESVLNVLRLRRDPLNSGIINSGCISKKKIKTVSIKHEPWLNVILQPCQRTRTATLFHISSSHLVIKHFDGSSSTVQVMTNIWCENVFWELKITMENCRLISVKSIFYHQFD